MKSFVNKSYIYWLYAASVVFLSCSDSFLNVKPNKKQVVPTTLEDLDLLLQDTRTLNSFWPSVQEIAADDLFLETSRWNSLINLTQRNAYIWSTDVFNNEEQNDWSLPYVVVFNMNVVLESLKHAANDGQTKKHDNIKGTALFFRAYAFYQLAQLFAPAYIKESAKSQLGIVIRTSSDINIKSTRASLQESYDRIIADLNESLTWLPDDVDFKTQPTKAAAYGLLARVYLSMSAYEDALKYADLCYALHSELLDFNELNVSDNNPIKRYNKEVIFHSTLLGRAPLSATSGRIDTVFINQYQDNDLRKDTYFRLVSQPNRYSFRGSYDGSGSLFGGIATDEILLIQAECHARLNAKESGTAALNELLFNRYKAGEFVELEFSSSSDLLDTILIERRKELIFRGIRWTDLKRLNLDPKYEKTLTRALDEMTYRLEPNGSRYTFPIPQSVVAFNGIEQNP